MFFSCVRYMYLLDCIISFYSKCCYYSKFNKLTSAFYTSVIDDKVRHNIVKAVRGSTTNFDNVTMVSSVSTHKF